MIWLMLAPLLFALFAVYAVLKLAVVLVRVAFVRSAGSTSNRGASASSYVTTTAAENSFQE